MRLKLYYHTLRYLKFSQLIARLWRKLKIVKPDLTPAPAIRNSCQLWSAPIAKPAYMVAPTHFNFLNEIHSVENATDWNNPNLSKLWLYNLHYFDDLHSINAHERQAWHQNLINRWINENPPAQGNGWEPYPLSLRLVNWVKWLLHGNPITPPIAHSLAVQARWLLAHLETHLLGNHLLANIKALIFVGLFFEGKEAEIWFKKGLNLLAQQLPEQILADGGHFERSPMYHAIILEDLLDILNLLNTYKQPNPAYLIPHIIKMLGWLRVMCHPDGQIALFNDAAFKIAAEPEQLFSYAQYLKLNWKLPASITESIFLPHSGYAHLTKNNIHLLADIANIGPDYLPGHAHADTLTFELSRAGQRIIVDSGTSCYQTSNERLRQRSTQAHNTVVVDQHNSSQVWSSFRVAQRARVRNIQFLKQAEIVTLKGQHNGYQHLAGHPIHQREWCLEHNKLTIVDTLLGKENHELALTFHFHPNISLLKMDTHRYFINDYEGHELMQIILDPKLAVEIIATTYHPEFGISVNNQKISGTLNAEFPLTLMTEFTWH